MNKTLTIDKACCKACGFCVYSCPKKALSLTGPINDKGYPTVEVDNELCIRCGICYNVCPDYVFEIIEEV